jgi:hypothetical protein
VFGCLFGWLLRGPLPDFVVFDLLTFPHSFLYLKSELDSVGDDWSGNTCLRGIEEVSFDPKVTLGSAFLDYAFDTTL